MKKSLIFMLVVIFILSFTGCGVKDKIEEKVKDKVEDMAEDVIDDIQEDEIDDEDLDEDLVEDTSEDSEDEDMDNEDSDEEDSEGDVGETSSDFSTALSTFVSNYLDAKSVFDTQLDESPEAEQIMMDLLGYYMSELVIAEVPMYDALNLGLDQDATKIEGKLMLSGDDAVKELDGDLIKFSSEALYEADENGHLTGDITKTTGYLDTKKEFLVIENTTERNGEIVQRTVSEILRQGDKFTKQYLFVDETTEQEGSFIFAQFENTTFDLFMANMENSADFDYISFEDEDNMSVDDVSSDYTQVVRIKMNDGVVEVIK